MTTFRLEIMTTEHYEAMVLGSNNYVVNHIEVEANSKDEAYENATANFVGFVINKNNIKTLAELEAEAQARLDKVNAEAEKKANINAKRLATEMAKAEALGVTLAEYRAIKAHNAQVKKVEKRIAELEAELAKAKRDLARLTK